MIRYAEFRQTRIRFSDTGKGRVIVLLHGFPETLEVWDEFAVKLARHFRIIAIDLPGHGESPCIGYIHTMELMAESVKAVMQSLSLRRYLIAGHSMGGYAALAFAELYGDQLTGICLFHSSALSETPEKRKERDRVIELVKRDTKHYINEVITSLFATENVSLFKEDIRELKHIAAGISRQGIINALEGMKERAKRDWILQYGKFPVLFIAGKNDRIIPYESILKQAESVKNAKVLMLENSGHMGFIEEKKLAQDALLKFARKCFRKN
jgi:pimeloyl-ACP methyl ester carboxylesterase